MKSCVRFGMRSGMGGRARIQRGFSLLEVLIAVVLLSSALLALATMQLISLRSSKSAFLRSQAVMMANDIGDRMRANQVAAAGGAYDVTLAQAGTAGTPAGDDVVEWKGTLASDLPAGSGAVQVAAGVATVTIEWLDPSMKASEDQTTSAGTNAQMVIRTSL